MIRKFKKNFVRIYYNLTRSIAFIPSLISLLVIILAVVAISLHETELSESLTKEFPWLEMRSASLASAILTTLLAGTISLTVFSFSMVMLVLNQAASNYTPKILYQIAQDKHNQVVLGFYVGAILYFIVLLVNFTKEDDALKVPNIAFFIAIIFGVMIIVLFVNFIHHITISIQVKQIIQMLYRKTKEEMKFVMQQRSEVQPVKEKLVIENNNWIVYYARETGYFQNIMPGLEKLLKEEDLIIKMEVRFGEYIINGNPLFSVNREINEKLQDEIATFFELFTEERVDDNYFYGFRQITEIAVKALSPGVNDPGTALICIDTLTDLLSLRACIPDLDYICDHDDKVRVILNPVTYTEMIFNIFTPIRNYGRNDFSIISRLLAGIQKLAFLDVKTGKFKDIYAENALALIRIGGKNFNNPDEKNQLNNLISKLNKTGNNYFTLPLLTAESY